VNESITKLRSNQLFLNVVAGALGGGAGSLLAEVVYRVQPTYSSDVQTVVFIGLWCSFFASVISTALFTAGIWYQRRELHPQPVLRAMLFGALAGFVAGGAAQWLYQQDIGSIDFQNYVLRTFSWGLAGALIGALLSRAIPNLGLQRGCLAGFIGGAIGGIGFLMVSMVLPDTFGRFVGVATLGAALGLAMYLAETLFREASLEVIWAPNESSRVSLGAQPVSIGGGEDQIFVRGLAPRVSQIIFQNGQIEHIETATGKRTPLQDGSRLRIGPINLVVHAGR